MVDEPYTTYPRCDLFVAGLQEIFFGDRRADGRHAAINRENHCRQGVNVDVRKNHHQKGHQHHIFRVFAALQKTTISSLPLRCDARCNIALLVRFRFLVRGADRVSAEPRLYVLSTAGTRGYRPDHGLVDIAVDDLGA